MQADPAMRSGLSPPRAITLATRVMQAIVVLLMILWVTVFLGGLALSPTPSPTDPATNNTGKLFNWHPLLMTFAFAVCMGEAVLAYKVPLAGSLAQDRAGRKRWHGLLHTAAVAAVCLGLTAAIKSHTLKRPAPMANFYSVHSALGVLACIMFAGQYAIGLYCYVWPRLRDRDRAALGPLHRCAGLSTWSVGLAAMAVGIQEKTTFVQLVASPGVRAGVMVLPALLVVALALYALGVFLHFAPLTPPKPQQPGAGGQAMGSTALEVEPLYTLPHSSGAQHPASP